MFFLLFYSALRCILFLIPLGQNNVMSLTRAPAGPVNRCMQQRLGSTGCHPHPCRTHYSTHHILAHEPRVTHPQLSQRHSATSAVMSLSIIHNVNLTNVLTHCLSLLITQKDFSMSGAGLRLTSKARWPKASAGPQQSNQEKGMSIRAQPWRLKGAIAFRELVNIKSIAFLFG